jgi:hypothetical protein
LVALALAPSARAAAHDEPGGADVAPPGAGVASKAPTGNAGSDTLSPGEQPLRWHGSVLSFDQSATTQSVGVGANYQSYDPTYEWWLAFKPRFYVFEHKTDALSLNLWMNAYLELTNSDTTTRYRELLLGPTYFWATYGHVLRERGEYKTSASIGPRVTIPTDQASRDSGEVIGIGAIAGVSQTFRLAGKNARALRGGRLGFGVIYNHPFDRATTTVNGSLARLREDVAGRTVISDQLTGEMNVKNSLSLSLAADVQVLQKLSFSLSYVWISAWRYAPQSLPLTLPTGDVLPVGIAEPTTYRVSTWLTSSVSYDAMKELSIGVGYYNLANQLAPDGTRRNPFWSPTARIFLTLTSNLDIIYQRLAAMRRGSTSSLARN